MLALSTVLKEALEERGVTAGMHHAGHLIKSLTDACEEHDDRWKLC